MEEGLGLIDSIINIVLNAKPSVFSGKKNILINRDEMLDMLEKLKILISMKSDMGIVDNRPKEDRVGETHPELFGLEGEALLRQANAGSDKIRTGANQYAESVLNNLLITLSKSANAIKNGKDRLNKYKGE